MLARKFLREELLGNRNPSVEIYLLQSKILVNPLHFILCNLTHLIIDQKQRPYSLNKLPLEAFLER
jgi:hypothetical protein